MISKENRIVKEVEELETNSRAAGLGAIGALLLAAGTSAAGGVVEADNARLLERFLRYVTFDTQSSETSGTHPSSSGQVVLANALAEELKALGAKDVQVSSGGYVYATLPASAGREGEPALGFLAHLDTAPDASGKGVKPRVVRYEGGVLPLGDSGRALDPKVFPKLNRVIGKRLVVTDGTTLLGGDDKLGLALCVSLAERLLASDAPSHREIRLCFTPDEEIGEGTYGFEPERFGAKLAYTVDGDDVALVENANFNAASATFAIRGVSVHPASAKGVMVNAIKVAGELLAALPPEEAPEHTCGRQGFYHPTGVEGSVGAAKLSLIIRDHDDARFEERKRLMQTIADQVGAKYPKGTITLTVKDQYYNMEQGIAKVPEHVERAMAAIRSVGLKPATVAIRGGTDGASLTRMGIPCPNLGTGGRSFHGECEYAIVEELEQALAIITHIATH